MLPFIVGAVVIGVGAYLLDDASSSNKRARRKYSNTCDEAEEWIEHEAYHARRKDSLDKLFKMKKAKRKVADAIYTTLKQANREFKQVNHTLKDSKESLSELFMKKKMTNNRAEKRVFQEEINLILASRKELFALKEQMRGNTLELKERLKLANTQTHQVQDEINQILE